MQPCLSCGACCQYFRVEFKVYELDELGGRVPAGLTEPVNGNSCRMRGTGRVPIRCVALKGHVGQRVSCSIYAQRPSPCVDLQPGSEGCERARARHGLPPLQQG